MTEKFKSETRASQKEKMIKTGNTSLFDKHVNKNYLNEKLQKIADKYTDIGKDKMAFYQTAKKYVNLEQTEEGKSDA